MSSHRIRLQGPWDARRLDRDEQPTRVFMPLSWEAIFGDESGRAEFCRKFNQPTNLEAHEQVWVVFDGIGGEGSVRLNGHVLGLITCEASVAEFEITRQLALHNELIVELALYPDRVAASRTAASSQNGLWGVVSLEIRLVDD
jgi:hypothetical protein